MTTPAPAETRALLERVRRLPPRARTGNETDCADALEATLACLVAAEAERDRLQGLIDGYANSIGARGHTEKEYYARLNAAEEALLDAATPRKPEEGD